MEFTREELIDKIEEDIEELYEQDSDCIFTFKGSDKSYIKLKYSRIGFNIVESDCFGILNETLYMIGFRHDYLIPIICKNKANGGMKLEEIAGYLSQEKINETIESINRNLVFLRDLL